MHDNTSDVIRNAYVAVLDNKHWDEVLDSIVKALGARAAVIVFQERGLPFDGFNLMSEYYRKQDQGIIDTYNQKYMHYEAPAWQSIAETKPGELFFDTDVNLSKDELDRQHHYAFTLEHLDIRCRIGFRISDNAVWSDSIIGLAYDASLDAVPPFVPHQARLLIPHLGRAIELGRTFSLLRQQYKAVIAALDRLHIGIAIVLPNGEVIASNTEASRLFDEGDAIKLSRDRKILLLDESKMT